jgi:hypothetical protein
MSYIKGDKVVAVDNELTVVEVVGDVVHCVQDNGQPVQAEIGKLALVHRSLEGWESLIVHEAKDKVEEVIHAIEHAVHPPPLPVEGAERPKALPEAPAVAPEAPVEAKQA